MGQGHLKDDAAGRSSRILVRSLSQVSGFSTYGSQPTDSRRREREFVHLFSRAVRLHQFGLGTMVAAACQSCQGFRPEKRVHKVCPLVVRTSRRGRGNPGSTPGRDIWMLRGCELAIPELLQGPAHGPLFSSKVLTNLQGSRRARKNVRGSCRYFD